MLLITSGGGKKDARNQCGWRRKLKKTRTTTLLYGSTHHTCFSWQTMSSHYFCRGMIQSFITWRNDNHLKLSTSKTDMDVAANLKRGWFTDIFNLATQIYTIKVGTYHIWSMVTITSCVPELWCWKWRKQYFWKSLWCHVKNCGMLA